MCLAFTFICLLGVTVYWAVAAVGNKADVFHQRPLARFLTGNAPQASYILLYLPLPLGWLEMRVFPELFTLQLAGCFCCVAGLAVAVWARRTIGRNWSGTVSIKEDHELVESGPYQWARHPIYSGLLRFVVSAAVVQGELRGLLAIAVLVVGLGWKIVEEEQVMMRLFPKEYAAYRIRVKRLIPFVFLGLVFLACTVAQAVDTPTSSVLSTGGSAPAPEHTPVFHVRSRTEEPLLRAEKPWESYCIGGGTVIREGDLWRMWYGAFDKNYKRDDDQCCCYAESSDGVHWTRPDLGIVEYGGSKNNNILISGPQSGGYCLSCVFLDEGRAAGDRYRMTWHRFLPQNAWWVYGGASSDGIHWKLLPQPVYARNSDTTTPCIPDGGKYRLYTRIWQGGDFKGARAVGYAESDHFGDFPEPVEILSADAQDPEGMQFYSNAATKLKDGLYVMLPAAFYTKNQTVRCHLAWSRDGVHFTRYGREPVVDLGKTFGTMGVYVMPRAVPGEAPNTWWFYYSGTDVGHDTKSADVNYDGAVGRFLLVVE